MPQAGDFRSAFLRLTDLTEEEHAFPHHTPRLPGGGSGKKQLHYPPWVCQNLLGRLIYLGLLSVILPCCGTQLQEIQQALHHDGI